MSYYACSAIKALTPNAYRRRQRKANLTGGTATSIAKTNGNGGMSSANANAKARAGTSNRSRTSGLENLHSIKRHSNAKKANGNGKANSSAPMNSNSNSNSNSKSNARNVNSNMRTRANSRIATRRSLVHNGNGNGNNNGAIIPSIPGLSGNVPPPSTTITFGNKINGNGNGTNNGKLDYAPALSQLTMTQSFSQSMDGTATTSSYGNIKHKGKPTGRGAGKYQSQNGKGNVNRTAANNTTSTTTRTRNGYPTRSQFQPQYQPRTTSTMSVPRNMVLASAPSFSSSISQSKVKAKSKTMPHSSLPSQAKMSNQNQKQKQRMNNNWTAGNNINTHVGSNSNNNSNGRTKTAIANATRGNNNRNQHQNRTRSQNSAPSMAMGLNRIDSSNSSSNIPIKNRKQNQNQNQNQTQSRPRPGPNAGPRPGSRLGVMGRTTRSTSVSSKGNSNLNQARRKTRQDNDIEDNDNRSDDEDYDDEDNDGYNLSHNREETLTSQPLLLPITSSSSIADRSTTSRYRSTTTGNVAAPHAHNANPKKRSWMDACVDILSTPYRRTRSRPTSINARAGGGKSSIGANGNGNTNESGSNIHASSAAQSRSLPNTTASRDVANRTTATTVSADNDNRSDKNLCAGNDATNKSIDRSNAAPAPAPALVPATGITGEVQRKEHVGRGGEMLSTTISTVSSTVQTPSRDNTSAVVRSGETSADAGAEIRIVATSKATTALSKCNGDDNGGNNKGSNSGSNALVPFDPNSTAITIAQQQHYDQMQLQLRKYKDEMTKTADELRSQLISELTEHETQLVSSTKTTLTELRLQSTTEAKVAMKKLSTEIEQGATQHLLEAKQQMIKDVAGMEETLKGNLSLATSKQKNTMLELEKASSDQLNRAKKEGMSFWDDFQKRRLEMEQSLEEKRKGMLDEVDRVVKEVFDGSDAEGNAEKVADCKNGNARAATAGESVRVGLRERIETEKNGALMTVRSAVQLMVESMIVSAKEKVDKIWKEDATHAHCAQEKKVIPASPSPADDVGVVGGCNIDIINRSEDNYKVNSNEKACDAETRKVTPFHSSNKNPIVHVNEVDEHALAKSTSNQDFVEDCNGKTGLQARKCNVPKEVTPRPHPVTKANARPAGKTMSSDDSSNKPNKKKETSLRVKSNPSEKKKRIQKPRRAKKNNSKTSAAINKSRTKTRRRRVVDPQTNTSKRDSPICKSKVDPLPQTIHITSESQQPVSPLRLPDMRAPRRSRTQRELAGTTKVDESKNQQGKMKKVSSPSSSADVPLGEELGTATNRNQDLASDGKKLVKSAKQARAAVRRYNLRSKVSSDHTKSSMKMVGTSRIEESDKSHPTPIEVAGGAIGTVQTVQTIHDRKSTSQNLDRVKPLRAKQPIAKKLQRKTPGDKSTRRILPPEVSSSSASYSSQILPDTNSRSIAAHKPKHTPKNNKMLQPSTPTSTSPIKRTPTITGRKHLSQKEKAPDAPKLRLRRRKRSTYAGRSRTTRTGRNDEGDIHFTSSAAMLSLGNLKISDTHYNSLQLPNVESIINDENAPVMPFTSPTGPTQSLAPRLPDLDELRYRPHRRTTLDIRTRPRLFDVDANDIFEFS